MRHNNENKKKDENNKRAIRVFALASFLNDLGSDMIYPVWPLFVTSVLGANMAVLGLIDGLGEAVVSLSQAASGYVSDKIRKRKIFIWLGYLFGALSRMGYAMSAAWRHLIPFRILDRAGKIRGAPRDAIIADISPKENRGRNFGLVRTMDNIGAVCGILISIALLALLGYKRLFLLAALPSLVAVLLIMAFIKEKKPSKVKIYKGISFKNLGRDFKLFLFLSSVFSLGSFSYSFLLIYAKQAGLETAFVPVLYLVFTVIASIFSLPFGYISDKIGRKPVLFLSYAFWIMVCLALIFFRSIALTVLAFVLYGLHKGAIEPVQKTFVAELSPKAYRASCIGGFQMVIGLVALPASLIAGLIWDKISMNAPFYFSMALSIASIIMLMFVKKR